MTKMFKFHSLTRRYQVVITWMADLSPNS